MKVRYIYSACVVLESERVRLCCDPWFTQGVYDGSWYQYPPLPEDPVEVIGQVDIIYISHIHPDHYDPVFLSRYLKRYPSTKLLVGITDPPYLLRKMKEDGFNPLAQNQLHVEDAEINIFVNRGYEGDNIDTALVFRCGDFSVVNLNDNPFDPEQVERILAVCPGRRPTVALLPHSGAGPYPQTYWFDTQEELLTAAERKKKQFMDLYSRYIDALKPHRAIPFAGKYYLGGPLAELNKVRGVSDAVEVLDQNGDVSVILADGGQAYLDLKTLQASAIRTKRYEEEEVRRYIASLPFQGYDYEREISLLNEKRSLPLLPLIRSAYAGAIKKTKVKETYWICLKPHHQRGYIVFNAFQDVGIKVTAEVQSLQPRLEIFIDPRYLFGLLTRLYHWNNAEVGSQYRSKRVPDTYQKAVYSFLNRLCV